MNRILIAVVAAASLATPAVAQDQYEVRIAYGDLNLSTESGADQMLERIRDAAEDVCDIGSATVGVRMEERACEAAFTRNALAELNRAAPQRMYARNEPNTAVTVASR